jgi:hypothetical protein
MMCCPENGLMLFRRRRMGCHRFQGETSADEMRTTEASLAFAASRATTPTPASSTASTDPPRGAEAAKMA